MFNLVNEIDGEDHSVFDPIASNGYANLECLTVFIVLAISRFQERLEVRDVSDSRFVTIFEVVSRNVIQSPRLGYLLVELMEANRQQQWDYHD